MGLLALGSVTLTSLVGLVTQFAGERRHAAAMTAEEFKAWLAENRHDDVVRLLEQNAHSLLAVRINRDPWTEVVSATEPAQT